MMSPDSTLPKGLESCFNYYTYGSVPVVLSSDTVMVAQGASLKLQGTIQNTNAYPITDATIYAKIYYKKNFEKNSFGPDVVDWFVLASDINLKAGQTLPVSYTWNVPANLEPGNYQVATFVASHDRFNLSGLSFSTDITGNLFNFNVAGEDQGALRFDNTKTVVNDIGYHTAIFSPRTDAPTDGVPITATVVNSSSAPLTGQIHWKLYSWDGLNEENLIDQSSTDVSVPGNSSKTVSYTVKDDAHTVYYLLAELDPANKGLGKSVITVRYVSSDTSDGTDAALDQPRIAFMGATAYPGTDDTKLFACVHSTGTKSADKVRVVLTSRPLDPISWLLHLGSLGSKTYTGSVPGQVSAVVAPMKAASNNFAVTTSLYQDGKKLDEVTTTYSCKEFGSCGVLALYGTWILAAIVVIILVIIILIVLARRRRPQPAAPVSQ